MIAYIPSARYFPVCNVNGKPRSPLFIVYRLYNNGDTIIHGLLLLMAHVFLIGIYTENKLNYIYLRIGAKSGVFEKYYLGGLSSIRSCSKCAAVVEDP